MLFFVSLDLSGILYGLRKEYTFANRVDSQ